MNFAGVIVGIVTIMSIAIYHPLVILFEYHFGLKARWIFALLGVLGIGGAILVHYLVTDSFWRETGETALMVFSFASFWSVVEVGFQRKRVLKGRFPKNPKRNDY